MKHQFLSIFAVVIVRLEQAVQQLLVLLQGDVVDGSLGKVGWDVAKEGGHTLGHVVNLQREDQMVASKLQIQRSEGMWFQTCWRKCKEISQYIQL